MFLGLCLPLCKGKNSSSHKPRPHQQAVLLPELWLVLAWCSSPLPISLSISVSPAFGVVVKCFQMSQVKKV